MPKRTYSEEMDRLVVLIPAWMKREIKAAAAVAGMSMGEYVTKVLKEAFSGKEDPRG